MRARIEQAKRYKTRGVSLPPDMEKAALKKASQLDVSFSKYVQKLIRRDMEQITIKVAA